MHHYFGRHTTFVLSHLYRAKLERADGGGREEGREEEVVGGAHDAHVEEVLPQAAGEGEPRPSGTF